MLLSQEWFISVQVKLLVFGYMSDQNFNIENDRIYYDF